MQWNSLNLHTFILKMEATYSFETSLSDYMNTLCHNPEDQNLNKYRHETLET